MRDIAVLLFFIYLIYDSIKTPWHCVLALAIFSYMNPHSYAWGFVHSLPLYLILFLISFLLYLKEKDKQSIFFDWRVNAFILLWCYFVLTTLLAMVPIQAELKLINVSKIYLPFLLTLSLINTRYKLYCLIVTIGCSFGFIAFKGGLFALATGFSYRVWGPPATQFEGNNEFAVATIIIIPFLILFRSETPNKLLKNFLLFAIPVCIASAISSWSRGALLALIGSGMYMLSKSKHKILLVPLIFIGVFILIPYLPQEWFSRMDTINTYEEDESAMTRIEAWTDGWNYAKQHPLIGAGFDGWIYVTQRDWHSAYVEIFSEHGFIAFGIWLSMLLGSFISLIRLPMKTSIYPELAWVTNYSTTLKASLLAYMIGSAFLGISYWDLLYHLIFISALIKKFALEELESLLKVKSTPLVKKIR
ncbi:putative O-glycosylation ligase, exosortase A system-associated [Methylomonas lenta]|uniref:Putative O-glycosylation ligase, exosortase A system-associated n=1 Tax=Methylomonas lenta TaxID=980561 RepID=A0A177NR12_9GAMM|nr:putative O-glycosylation ligase, exosortase A system-associated [Methylomonas lenta]OAI20518.1 putative O-glycosylation ligase, exosortase A system-associated [Methylomonas lenta]